MLGHKTIRRRPLFRGMSPSPDTSEGEDTVRGSEHRLSVVSKKSGGTIRSGGGKSVASSFADGIPHDIKWFRAREYLLILIEASLSLASYVISIRNFSGEELARVRMTKRAVRIRSIYFESYSAIISLVIGCVADSFIRHYTMALFTVILHFAAVCLVFMEETVKGNQKGNPYAEILWNVCTVVLVLIKSSDFTRLVYALEGMTNRRKSTIHVFIFIHYWVSSYATWGGVIVNVFSGFFSYTNTRLTIVAFIGTGISLYLFVYVLVPETAYKDHKGLGCRVIGCLLLATYYETFRIRIRGKNGFLAKTEVKFDKTTVSRTKEILILYALLTPMFGMAFWSMMRAEIFFEYMFEKVKSDKFTNAVGLPQLLRTVASSSMLLSFFVLWPLLTLMGVRKRETVKYLVGHSLCVVAMFYASGVGKNLENPKYSSSSGFVRIFNTRKEPIHFQPLDLGYTTLAYTIGPKSGRITAYPATRNVILFAMHVFFNGTTTNFTTYLSVTRDQATGYMVVDPPGIVRIRGPFLPLREGPPGTNEGSWPRIFIYNTAVTLQGSTVRIRLNHSRDHLETVGEVVVPGGAMPTIALRPAKYEFVILQTNIRKTVDIEEGAVYGLMIFATPSSREMEVDVVIPPNSAPIWPLLGLTFFVGLCSGLVRPSIRAIIFNICPRGLTSVSFAFFAHFEGISLCIIYIGFITWHEYISTNVIFIYSFGFTLFFTINLFVLVRFRDQYT